MSYKQCVILFLLAILSTQIMAQEQTPELTEVSEITQTPEVIDFAELSVAPESAEMASEFGTYTVQVGDTLFKVAVDFGLTIDELVTANNLSNSSLIYTGQVLIIPNLPPTETSAATTESVVIETGLSYTVQAGDSLTTIATNNNTTVNTLISLNPEIGNNNVIFVGQVINLPLPPEATPEPEPSYPARNFPLATGIEVFLGDELNFDELLSQLAQLNISWVKITVDWAVLEPEPNQFVFGRLDLAIQALDAAGYKLILTLTGAPDWSRPSATELALQQPTYGPPDDLHDYGDFVGTVAKHYAGVVDAYEIWYQPNSRLSWMIPDVTMRDDGFPDARLSPVLYIDMLEIASTAIISADPDTLIISSGLAPTDINDFYNAIDNFIYLEELLSQGLLNYADVIGVHIEGFSNPPDAECCTRNGESQFDNAENFYFSDTLNNYRSILDRNNGESVPMWITQIAWGTANNSLAEPQPNFDFIKQNTIIEQAAYFTSAFQLANERNDVGPMIYYNLNGCAVNLTQACFYSAIDATNSARPVFRVLANIDLTNSDD